MRYSLYRWLAPVPACALQQFVLGSFYALGVFASRFQEPALTVALGIGSWTLAVAIAVAGYILHTHSTPTTSRHFSAATTATSPSTATNPQQQQKNHYYHHHHHHRQLHLVVRFLSFLGALLLATQMAFPAALSRATADASSWPLCLAAAAHSAGYGILYVISICTLQAWVPESPGTATGALIFTGGVGLLCFVILDSACVQTFGSPERAIIYVGAIQTILAMLAAAFISMPPASNWHPKLEKMIQSLEEEATPLLTSDHGTAFPDTGKPTYMADDQIKLLSKSGNPRAAQGTFAVLSKLLDPTFGTLLIVCIAGFFPGYGVILHGSRMQTVLLAQTHDVAERRFFVITFVGVLTRLLVGVAADLLAEAKRARNASTLDGWDTETNADDAIILSARDLTAGFIVLQIIALSFFFVLLREGAAKLFAVGLALLSMSFNAVDVL